MSPWIHWLQTKEKLRKKRKKKAEKRKYEPDEYATIRDRFSEEYIGIHASGGDKARCQGYFDEEGVVVVRFFCEWAQASDVCAYKGTTENPFKAKVDSSPESGSNID